MWSQTYDFVSQHGCDVDEKEFHVGRELHRPSARWKVGFVAINTILLASLILNSLFLYQRYVRPWDLYNDLPTKFTQLRRDVPRDAVAPEEYSSLNRTIQDKAWEDPRLNSWRLFVALEEEYAMSQGLPHSQRWPWDSGKGVYVFNAAHELHCVIIIRIYINEKIDGVPEDELTWSYAHSIHCLNALRESVMCNADDQLLYIGRLHENIYYKEHEAGRGMTKMCRNWDRLMDWANEHSACYQSVNRKDPDFQEIDRYKYCPDDSKPWDKDL